jgi:hypothetical protein
MGDESEAHVARHFALKPSSFLDRATNPTIDVNTDPSLWQDIATHRPPSNTLHHPPILDPGVTPSTDERDYQR